MRGGPGCGAGDGQGGRGASGGQAPLRRPPRRQLPWRHPDLGADGVCVCGSWAGIPRRPGFSPPCPKDSGGRKGKSRAKHVRRRAGGQTRADAGRRGQDGRRERSAPCAPTGAHGEGRRAPEAVRSEGWSEGAIVPQGEERACWAWPLAVGGRRPMSLGCGASVSRPRAALGLADSSAERRRPGPTSHGGLSRSLSCAWVAPLRGGGRGGAEPPSAPPTAETGLSPFQLRA